MPAADGPSAESIEAPGPAAPVDRTLEVFARARRAAAEKAMREQRWATALREWDVVLALQPDDAPAATARARAREAARSAAAALVDEGEAAQRRGETVAAMRLYLQALALWPDQAQASKALRELEAARMRRTRLQPFAAPMQAARAPAAAKGDRNAVEHASLLAEQGELEAAVALLLPLSASRGGDAQARALLAELYVQQADALSDTDRGAAIAALERSLKLRPGHAPTQQRLLALRRAAALSSPSQGPSSAR